MSSARVGPSTNSSTSAGACWIVKCILEAVDVADVRMIERRQDLRLATETAESVSVGRKRVGHESSARRRG